MKKTLAGILIMFFILTGCEKEDTDRYVINSNQSSVTWTGSSPLTANTGTFSVEGDDLRVRNGKLLNTSFIIPVNSINVTNLPPGLKQVLTDHLLSVDFFNVLVHPIAVYRITDISPLTGTPPAGSIANANTMLSGYLTMKSVTKPVNFAAKINISNNSVEAEALLKINRTDWGINYAADPALGDNHIFPVVELGIVLKASRN